MPAHPSKTGIRGGAVALALMVGAVSAALGCGGGSGTPGDGGPPPEGDAGGDGAAVACTVEAPTVCPDPPLRFADVSPIFQRRCAVCHYGAPGGPWPLLQYQHIADWYDTVRAFVLDCTMPPPGEGVTMEDAEREAILTWILCGLLE